MVASIPDPFQLFNVAREGLVSESHVHDITRRETVERPTSEQGASKVTKILSALVATDGEVWFKHLLPFVVRSL